MSLCEAPDQYFVLYVVMLLENITIGYYLFDLSINKAKSDVSIVVDTFGNFVVMWKV
jgi:hypothetical protein